jgi:hypothetical protein
VVAKPLSPWTTDRPEPVSRDVIVQIVREANIPRYGKRLGYQSGRSARPMAQSAESWLRKLRPEARTTAQQFDDEAADQGTRQADSKESHEKCGQGYFASTSLHFRLAAKHFIGASPLAAAFAQASVAERRVRAPAYRGVLICAITRNGVLRLFQPRHLEILSAHHRCLPQATTPSTTFVVTA